MTTTHQNHKTQTKPHTATPKSLHRFKQKLSTTWSHEDLMLSHNQTTQNTKEEAEDLTSPKALKYRFLPVRLIHEF